MGSTRGHTLSVFVLVSWAFCIHPFGHEVQGMTGWVPDGSARERADDDGDVKARLDESVSKLCKAGECWRLGDGDKAVALLREALHTVLDVPGSGDNERAAAILKEIGRAAYMLRDYQTARSAWETVEASQSKRLPPDDLELQKTRIDLAVVLSDLGEYARATAMEKGVLEILEKRGEPHDPLLQKARGNHAITLKVQGRYREALAIEEAVLAVEEKIFDQDNLDLQRSRLNLAATCMVLGDYRKSRALMEDVLAVYEALLPCDDLRLQIARMNFGSCLNKLGDPLGALEQYLKVEEVYDRILDDDDLEFAKLKMNMALAHYRMANIREARPLAEDALASYERNCHPDDPLLQKGRFNLAVIVKEFGDWRKARVLEEQALAVFERTLSEEDPDYLNLLTNYAQTLRESKELQRALEIEMRVLEIEEKLYGSDHTALQATRLSVANTLHDLRRYGEAEALFRQVMKKDRDALPADSPERQKAVLGLASTRAMRMDLPGACALFEQVLTAWERLLPPDHPNLQRARLNYAGVLTMMGRHGDSLEQIGRALEGARTLVEQEVRSCSVREIDASALWNRWILDRYLSLDFDGSPSDEACFEAHEFFRAAGLRAERIDRIVAREGGEGVRRLQDRLRAANMRIASAPPGEIADLVFERDAAARNLRQALMNLPEAERALAAFAGKQIAEALPEGWDAVSIVRYDRTRLPRDLFHPGGIVPSYAVFLIDREGGIGRVELGPAEPIDEAVRIWREALSGNNPVFATDRGIRSVGQRIKSLVWDPIRDKLGEAERLIVEPDAVLATVPLGALPEGEGVLSDRYTVVYVNALSSLALETLEDGERAGGLAVFGDIDYDALPRLFGEDQDPSRPARPTDPPRTDDGVSHGTSGSRRERVKSLPGTRLETESVGRIYQQVFDHEPLLVRGAWASKASFMELAPKMRYLHIATHGRFLSDETLPDPSGKRGDGDDLFSMPARRTLGLAPSVFCGICLAGCNRFGGDLGNDGVVTAEEIQGMDLTACELAVLSACETNVGVIRPGQGIMSLQRALRMAGVRGSITSLWKVDDRATSLLFEEFYRLMWEERLNPPEALQRAQEHLRNSPALKEMPATMGDGNSEDRGVTKDGRRKGDDPPYAQPKHWAAFVYWGDVM